MELYILCNYETWVSFITHRPNINLRSLVACLNQWTFESWGPKKIVLVHTTMCVSLNMFLCITEPLSLISSPTIFNNVPCWLKNYGNLGCGIMYSGRQIQSFEETCSLHFQGRHDCMHKYHTITLHIWCGWRISFMLHRLYPEAATLYTVVRQTPIPD